MSAISKRARDLLEKKRHFSADLDQAYIIECDENDNFLTVRYGSLAQNFEIVLIEALGVLLKNRPITELLLINFRELESFLRDENHLPAFLDDQINGAQESFKYIKATLLARAMRTKLLGKGFVLPDWSSWGEKELIIKNQEVVRCLYEVNSFFNKADGWRLVLCQHFDLIIAVEERLLVNLDIETFFFEAFGVDKNSLTHKVSIKVVAVQ